MPAAREIDATDREIIDQLQANAKQTLAEIADTVNLSAPAVKRRIDRLEQIGVITGYTIRVDHAMLGRPLDAFTELRFSGSTPIDDITEIAAETPEIESVFTIAGDPDALVRIRVHDVEQLKKVVDRLRHNGKVTGTKTLMVLGAWSRDGRSASRL